MLHCSHHSQPQVQGLATPLYPPSLHPIRYHTLSINPPSTLSSTPPSQPTFSTLPLPHSLQQSQYILYPITTPHQTTPHHTTPPYLPTPTSFSTPSPHHTHLIQSTVWKQVMRFPSPHPTSLSSTWCHSCWRPTASGLSPHPPFDPL